MKNNVSSKILLSDEMEDMLNDAEMKNLHDELFLQLGVDESESGIKPGAGCRISWLIITTR